MLIVESSALDEGMPVKSSRLSSLTFSPRHIISPFVVLSTHNSLFVVKYLVPVFLLVNISVRTETRSR